MQPPMPGSRSVGYRLREDDGSCDLDTYELKQSLLELFSSPDYKPPLLPAVALELLELTRNPRATVSQVVTLLGHDPLLAGQLLSLARSALYSRGEPIRSLDEAVVRLGLARAGDLFLRVSLEAKVFRAPGYSDFMEQLRKHSAVVAEAARVISQSTSGLNDYAFLCGLLHDAGVAACILALAGPLRGRAPADFKEAWPCVKEVHESCSEALARVWGLPPDVALVLQLHHRPNDGGHVHPLAAAVCMADSFADLNQAGFLTDANPTDYRESAAMLGLNGEQFRRVDSALTELGTSLGLGR